MASIRGTLVITTVSALAIALSTVVPVAAGGQTNPAPLPAVSSNVRLRINTPTYFPDGRVLGAASTGWSLRLNETFVAYAGSGRTLCESTVATSTTPTAAGYGWRLDVTPIREAPGELVVRVAWQRQWEAGAAAPAGKRGGVELTLHPGDRIIVDYLNAASTTRTAQEYLAKWQKAGAPYGTTADAAAAALARKRAMFESIKAKVSGASSPACNAIGMALEIGLEPAGPDQVVDAELWLVRRRLADGVEESERQVVQLTVGHPSTPFHFGDVRLQTLTEPLDMKVSGDLSVSSLVDGKLGMNLTISRRYAAVSGASSPAAKQLDALGSSTALTGIQAAPGEVVSFELPGRLGQRPIAGKTASPDKSGDVIVFAEKISKIASADVQYSYSFRLRPRVVR